ncbi:MAG TPA: HTTM domain-containing protein [Kofleriaceae bacterium]|nr:HTTM domain-containing protein [Kofleriaceae bacterium]
MRILTGLFVLGYVLIRGWTLWHLAAMPRRDFAPVGLARYLHHPLDAAAHHAIVVAMAVLAVTYTAGLFHRWLAPPFAVALLWVMGYRSSFGMLFHTDNLLVMHVAVIALAPAADAWSVDAWRRARRGLAPAAAAEAHGWPLRLLAALTCLTYFIAGVAKLKLGGWAWAHGDQLREQVAIDNVRKALLGSPMSPLARPMLAHGRLFAVMAVMSLTVELGAPLALLHRRIAAVWSIAAWGFHLGVLALMAILFPYPLAGLAYAPFFRLERLFAPLARRLRRLRRAPAAAASEATARP